VIGPCGRCRGRWARSLEPRPSRRFPAALQAQGNTVMHMLETLQRRPVGASRRLWNTTCPSIRTRTPRAIRRIAAEAPEPRAAGRDLPCVPATLPLFQRVSRSCDRATRSRNATDRSGREQSATIGSRRVMHNLGRKSYQRFAAARKSHDRSHRIVIVGGGAGGLSSRPGQGTASAQGARATVTPRGQERKPSLEAPLARDCAGAWTFTPTSSTTWRRLLASLQLLLRLAERPRPLAPRDICGARADGGRRSDPAPHDWATTLW